MALVSIANLSLSLGDRILLQGVNLTLDQGEHVGFVGVNGSGKSTLMKLIAGIPGLKHDSGQIQVAKTTSVGYLTQDPVLDLEKTLRQEAQTAFEHLEKLQEELDQVMHDMATAEGDALEKLLKQYEAIEEKIQSSGGLQVDHLIEATLHGLGLTDEFFDVKVKDLSGGQKGRLALAKLLLSRPDVLLLDEPTNHLDIAGCEWLEEFLSTYPGAVMLISHDRWLLDRAASKIYELQEARLVEYPGNYQAYREQRALRMLTQQRMYEKQQERIKSEQNFIDRFRAGQRARQAAGREKRLDRLKRDDLLERPMELDTIRFKFRPPARCGDLVIVAENISKAYPDKPLFADFSITIKRGDRVGIIGPNGAGKSTLIRCLLGETPVDSGTVKVGPSVNVGHYKQNHEHLNSQTTIVDYLRRFVRSETEQEARDLAGAFLFSGDSVDKPMGVLSGGERSRAVLAGLICKGHNLLILDEPTNHLDIPSCERLEEAMKQFTEEPSGFAEEQTGGGTLILITHDRMLLEDLVDQLIVFDGNGNVQLFTGTYSEYVTYQKLQTAKALEEAQNKAKKPQPAGKPAPKPATSSATLPKPKNHVREFIPNSSISKLSQEALEDRIHKIEAELAKVDNELANPDIYRDPAKAKKFQDNRIKLATDLEPLEAEWLRRADNA
jgi:ATP-binding cassette subfamily F protein 3